LSFAATVGLFLGGAQKEGGFFAVLRPIRAKRGRAMSGDLTRDVLVYLAKLAEQAER